VQVAILGPLAVEDGAQPIEVGGARLRALLIRLAASANGWVSVSTLVEALWEEDPPGDEVNALQSLISRLRRALPKPELIESGPAGYRLAVDPESVDAIRFERLVARGRARLADGHPEEASAVLSEALGLWRGEALTEVATAAYASAWVQRLDNLRLTAIDNRADAALQLGRHSDPIAELEEVAATHPLRERSHELLIRALAGAGRQGEALAVYELLRQGLSEQLGLDPPIHIQQLQTAVLNDDPSLRPEYVPVVRAPVRRRRTNLRAQLTSFVGRREDLRGLRTLLETSRLVTLVGPGGAGKTRLAGEVASDLSTTGSDGVWMVELAPVTDPNVVASTTLGSLGGIGVSPMDRTTPPSHRDALTRLVETLADNDVVLVLDNCEHLIDAAAKLAEYLLGQCPRLTVLATSREPLGIVGESLWPVHPLPAPHTDDDVYAAKATPAVQLFTDRAALVRPGFTVTAENAAAVSEICRRLDGLPLAIELAAARLRNLPVEAVAARLSNRFRLLTGGSRTAMPRHQTLRAVVAWTWDLLTDSERRLAERLSVFLGGASTETAEAICSAPELDDAIAMDAIPDLLAALADKSVLVIVDGKGDDDTTVFDRARPRYRMLETIREFSTERLAERGELLTVRRAHARYFLELAETAEPILRTRDQLIWLDRLTAERENLLGTLRFAVEVADADMAIRLGAALSWYWTLLGRHDEAAGWLGQALGVPGERPDAAYAIVKVVHTMSAAAAGMGIPSDEAATELLKLTEGLDGDHPLLALIEPGVALLRDDNKGGQQAVARNLLRQSDPWTRAMLHLMSGMTAENDGDLEQMEQSFPLALEGFREIGDRWGIGATVGSWAILASARGETEAAVAGLEEARRMMSELRAREDEAYTLIRVGMMRLRLPDLVGARRDLEQAQQIADETNAPLSMGFVKFALGILAHYEGDDEAARRSAEEALVVLGRAAFAPPQINALVLAGLAMLDIHDDRLDVARDRLRAAGVSVRSSRDMPVGAQVCMFAAELMLAEGDAALAAELLGVSAGLRGMEDLGDPEVRRIAAAIEAPLGTEEFTRLRSRGRNLDRAAALALLESSLAAPPPNPA
jgi:predicted ATPase/DNA-binding SARP family transcriptional activator